MNLQRLLTIGAVLLTSGGLWAQTTSLADPVPQKATFQYYDAANPSDDAELYLYNIGSKGFIIGANNWNTRGSISTSEGYKMRVSKYIPTDGEWDGASVLIEDYNVVKGNKWLIMFPDNADGNLFMDHGSQPNQWWNIYPQGDEIYRFGTSNANPDFPVDSFPGKYLGHYYAPEKIADTGTYGTRLFWNADPAEANVDWYFVQPAAYDVWHALFALKTQIEALEAIGGDASEYIAIYQKADVTVDEINAAIEAAKAAIKAIEDAQAEAAINNATVDNPADITKKFVANPSYDNNNNTGWSGDAPAFQSYTDAEWYNVANKKTYQKLTGLPEGVYAVKLQAFFRPQNGTEALRQFEAGATEKKFVLYAVSEADSATVGIRNTCDGATAQQESESGSYITAGDLQLPNNMECAEGYFQKGLYPNSLLFGTTQGEATIGLTKLAPGNNDWCIWDMWELVYYGKGADACQLWYNDAKKNLPSFEDQEGILYTDSYMDAFLEKKDVEPAMEMAAIEAYLAEVKTLADSLTANVEAWAAYKEAVQKGSDIANDPSLADEQPKLDLADYCDMESEDFINDRNTNNTTTQQVKDETAKLNAMIDYVLKNCLTVGADVSDKYLVNPDFEQGDTGWSGGPVMGGSKTNKCAEAYERNFDVYQVVEGAPVGFYEIEVQAFYRPGFNDSAWPAYVAAGHKADVESEVYMNNYAQKVMCLYDEWQNPLVHDKSVWQFTDLAGPAPYVVEDPDQKIVGTNDDGTDIIDSMWFCNDMTNTAIAFSNGMYKSTACGIVAKQGDVLRLGIRRQAGGNQPNGNWTIYDNFKLTFQGKDADKIRPALEKAVAEAGTHAQEVISAGTLAAINAAIAAGNDALTGNDGNTMFDALAANYDAIEAAKVSAANYQKIATANDDLLNTITENQDSADPDILAAATALYEEIGEKYAARTLENEDIEAYLVQITEMKAKLAIPADYKNASDDNPVDLSRMMQSPDFEKDGANSIEGWQGTSGYNFGNDDTQKSALALEFYGKDFDMYQDINGLPNGTYEVAVNAFGRNGNGYDNYKKWADAPYSIGVIYAIPANDSASMSAIPLQMVWNGMNMEEEQETKTGSEIKDPDGNILGYIPNYMTEFRFFVENYDGCFRHALITKVTDGTLRVGMKSNASMASGERWIIQDDWQLIYFGENSSKTATGNNDPTGIATLGAAKAQLVEVYNLGGMRTAGFNKGINIVKFKDAQGNTVVRKVVVK